MIQRYELLEHYPTKVAPQSQKNEDEPTIGGRVRRDSPSSAGSLPRGCGRFQSKKSRQKCVRRHQGTQKCPKQSPKRPKVCLALLEAATSYSIPTGLPSTTPQEALGPGHRDRHEHGPRIVAANAWHGRPFFFRGPSGRPFPPCSGVGQGVGGARTRES